MTRRPPRSTLFPTRRSSDLSQLQILYKMLNEDPQRLKDVPQDMERSEEHTSELQSRGHLVCRLLLEKKKSAQKLAALEATRQDQEPARDAVRLADHDVDLA